jgi:lipooligosaccharide transport system permease protein
MHPLAYATPLYHGVDLCRMLVLGGVDWASAGWDLLYLVALSAFGVLIARRTFASRLVI